MPLPDTISEWPAPFDAIVRGLVGVLEDDCDITCWPFEGHTIPGTLPAATIVCEDGSPSFRGAQQAQRIGVQSWLIRYYTPMSGGLDPLLVWQDAYTALAQMMDAIGADLTLGGNVASIIPERYSIEAVETRDGGRTELMVELTCTIRTAGY